MKNKLFLPFFVFLFFHVPFEQVQAQAISPAISNDEKLSYIGMTLAELIERFGTPRNVAVARGNETWQDDVVFQYANADFYIHGDRVWQVKFSSACGISVRDRKTAVMSLLGKTATDNGNHALLSISDKNWPITLRINFNNSGQVTAIFIYRPDF